MNILFETPVYYSQKGGAESLIEDLADCFVRKGHMVSILTQKKYASLPSFETRNGIRIFGIKYFANPFRHPIRALCNPVSAMAKIHEIITRDNIDVVCIGLFGLESVFILIAGYFLKFRLVTYIHGAELRKHARHSLLMRLIFKICLKRSGAIIAVSDKLREEAVRFAPFAGEKISVIHNGVDREKILAQKEFKRSRGYILYVGRLHPVKGADILVKAFIIVSKKVGDLDLLIVGVDYESHGMEDRLRELIAQNGLRERVVFMGIQERESVFSLIKGCEFMVLPSLAEGCPIVVLEALASGKFTIGSRAKGISEIIEDGENGILFASGDIEELSRLIVHYHLNRDERVRLEEKIKKFPFEDRYDIGGLSESHLRVYSS